MTTTTIITRLEVERDRLTEALAHLNGTIDYLRQALPSAVSEPQPTAPAEADPRRQKLPCPDCGGTYLGAAGLGLHRRKAHGIVGATKPQPKAKPPRYVGPAIDCPECGREYATPQGLGSHRWRSHGVEGTAKVKPEQAASSQPGGNGSNPQAGVETDAVEVGRARVWTAPQSVDGSTIVMADQ
jgi:hypothetical protein